MRTLLPLCFLLSTLGAWGQETNDRVFIEEIRTDVEKTLQDIGSLLQENPEAAVDTLIRLEWQARGKDRNKMVSVPYEKKPENRGGRYVGAHRWIVDRIGSLQPRPMEYYREQVDAEALSLLKGYELTGALEHLWDLLDAYRHSSYGARAAELLQEKALENGDAELAVLYGDLALELGTEQPEEVLLRQTVALIAERDFEGARYALSLLPDVAPWNETRGTVAGWIDELASAPVEPRNVNAQRPATGTAVPLPAGTFAAAGEEIPLRTAGPVGIPVLHNGVLYYNTGTRSYAVDLEGGRTQALPFQLTETKLPANQQHLLFGGTVAHGVYYANAFSERYSREGSTVEEGGVDGLFSNLYAYDLARGLAILWSTSDLSFLEEEEEDPLITRHFSATPVVLGDFVITTAMTLDQESEVYMHCFRAGPNQYSRPELLWQHFLVARTASSGNMFGASEVERRLHHSTIASHRGRVIVNTNYGVTLQVEPFSGDIVWMHKYLTSDEPINNDMNAWGAQLNPGLQPSPVQSWNTPIFTGDPRTAMVIYAPYDSHTIWWSTLDYGNVPYYTNKHKRRQDSDKVAVMGPWQAINDPEAPPCLVLYGGNEISVVRFATGQRLMKGVRMLPSTLTGPPVLRGDELFCPTESGLQRLTLTATKGSRFHEFDVILESLDTGEFENAEQVGQPVIGPRFIVLPTPGGVYVLPREGAALPDFDQSSLPGEGAPAVADEPTGAPGAAPAEELRLRLRRLMPER